MMRRALITSLCLFASPAMAELEVVIVEGLGGEPRYAEQFAEQVSAIEAAAGTLTQAGRIAVFRSGDFGRDELIAHFEEVSTRIGADDRLAVFLVGHGSYDDHEYKFNIAGPDITDTDLRDVLEGAGGRSTLLVNTSSSSGATVDRLKADDRTLILATRSGSERHATRFGGYFVAALSNSSADLDKNRIVSAEEAFRFAERQVSDYYERNGQLATEHPRLEGSQAARFSLARLDASRPSREDDQLSVMLNRRDVLNDEIDALRLRRDSMTTETYQAELLEKMIELATLEDEIELREQELSNDN
jgi:hypothetical protein